MLRPSSQRWNEVKKIPQLYQVFQMALPQYLFSGHPIGRPLHESNQKKLCTTSSGSTGWFFLTGPP